MLGIEKIPQWELEALIKKYKPESTKKKNKIDGRKDRPKETMNLKMRYPQIEVISVSPKEIVANILGTFIVSVHLMTESQMKARLIECLDMIREHSMDMALRRRLLNRERKIVLLERVDLIEEFLKLTTEY